MKIALVNSRKPRRVCPTESWLSWTMALGYAIARAGHTLCTSVGTLGYEAALFGAAMGGGSLEVFVSENEPAHLTNYLPSAAQLNCLITHRSGSSDVQRDRDVIDAAELVIAVAIRAGGHMESLLRARWDAGKPVQVVRHEEQTATWRGSRNLANLGVPDVDTQLLTLAQENMACRTMVSPEQLDWTRFFPSWRETPLTTPTLAHFTRSTDGPWPGQSPAEYLEDLWIGGTRARRDAPATLMRILQSSTIVGSSRLIRGAFPVVSLTAISPEQVHALHRYRAHLIRWDFEPWGIVFDRNLLVQKNAHAVKYLPSSSYRNLPAEEKPYFQKHEPPHCDYSAEEEWRIVGNLDFSTAPRDAVRLVLGE